MENLDEQMIEKKGRPTFLTVLCILTFIGSGWGIISSLVQQDAGISAYASYFYWVTIVLNLGTLFGGFQMWQMKKTGLYIWTACEVIAVVLMWVVIKGYIASLTSGTGVGHDEFSQAAATMGSAMIEGVMNTALIIGSIFPAVFVLLFWLNAKHLK